MSKKPRHRSRVPTGRLERIARIGWMAGEFALGGVAEGARRFVGRRDPGAASVFLTGANARRLARRLSRMRGAAMKVGQLLSLEGDDMLPPEFSEALAILRSAADMMPASQVRRALGREYGKGWQSRFRHFDFEPIAAASIGRLLVSRGFRVQLQKFDPYINVDPGTMSPFQHGEVFVTEDGAETDLDLGHYERFTDENTSRASNVTAGGVYNSVIRRERRGDYLGATVQVIPHVTDEIKQRILILAESHAVDFVISEKSGPVPPRRPGLVGLNFLRPIVPLLVEVLDRVPFLEHDDRLLPGGAPAIPAAHPLHLPDVVLRADGSHLDAEQLFDRAPDLDLVRFGRDLECVGTVALDHLVPLLRDDGLANDLVVARQVLRHRRTAPPAP